MIIAIISAPQGREASLSERCLRMNVSPTGKISNNPRLPLLILAALASFQAGTPALAQESVQELDTVVVTASGFEQDIKSAPASISVITRDDLEEKAFTD